MDRYIAKPIHIYLYAVPLLIAGSVVFALEWYWLGAVLFLFGILMGFWIMVAGLVTEYTTYWDRIAEDARILDKTRNPEVWHAMGYEIPERADPKWLPADVPPRPGELHTSLFQPKLTGPRLTQFVDGILQGKSLAETEWSPRKNGKLLSSAEYRDLKQELRKHKLIRQVNASNPLLGDCLTAKGRRELLAYASGGVRAMLEHDYASSPPLLKGGSEPLLE